jgi:hypothetical protein
MKNRAIIDPVYFGRQLHLIVEGEKEVAFINRDCIPLPILTGSYSLRGTD